jgi:hypothetical protein
VYTDEKQLETLGEEGSRADGMTFLLQESHCAGQGTGAAGATPSIEFDASCDRE